MEVAMEDIFTRRPFDVMKQNKD